MTKEEIIDRCLNDYTEDEILERIAENIHNYIDDDDMEDYEDFYEAYSELGRGEAESDVLRLVLKPFEGNIDTDLYCEVWDALCEEWTISTN